MTKLKMSKVQEQANSPMKGHQTSFKLGKWKRRRCYRFKPRSAEMDKRRRQRAFPRCRRVASGVAALQAAGPQIVKIKQLDFCDLPTPALSLLGPIAQGNFGVQECSQRYREQKLEICNQKNWKKHYLTTDRWIKIKKEEI